MNPCVHMAIQTPTNIAARINISKTPKKTTWATLLLENPSSSEYTIQLFLFNTIYLILFLFNTIFECLVWVYLISKTKAPARFTMRDNERN